MLTIVAGVALGVVIQTGVSFSALLTGEEEARRDTSPANQPPGAAREPLEVLVGRSELPEKQDGPGPGPEAASSKEKQGGREDKEKPEAPPAAASREPLNVLVLGVDRRPGASEESSSRSDTMMLAQVTPGTGRVELLSVPRDLFVQIEPGVEDRINTAYAYGGTDQAKAVMEGVTGVPIDSYAIIDFAGFEETIDAVGGVRVDVGTDQFPEKWKMGEGEQRLGGRKALFYARYRGTAGGDLDRIGRQQKMLAALRDKILDWNTVTRLPGVLETVNKNIDTDLGLIQAVSLGRALAMRGGEGDLKAVQLKGYPETLPGGAQVLMPDDEANEAILEDFRE